MIGLIIAVFLIGYLFIALEHPLKIDKAATALVTGIVVWVLYSFAAPLWVPELYGAEFSAYLAAHPSLASESLTTQVMGFVEEHQIIAALGEISEILFFLIGAMTIVELIDANGGFDIITRRITTRDKRKLLWIIGGLTFFMSATLDNLTTAIVMVTLLRKLVGNYKERWLYAGIIILAANSGGAWSPIGDVTTIMLWVGGNVTTGHLIPWLILPCIVAFVVPTWIASRWLNGEASPVVRRGVATTEEACTPQVINTRRERILILVIGVTCLLFVPVFKSITHLPPFMGILLSLGAMWVYTEVAGRRKAHDGFRPRVSYVLRRIDTPTILFFLGILLAVSAMQASGILADLSVWLDEKVHDVYAINLMVGSLSAVVDNVPLVAGSMATYPLVDPSMVAAAADPAYTAAFVQDGNFWTFLAYCGGVGGSMLVIGSAAGVVVMGLERLNFVWYFKHISWLALVGYLAGAGVYILQQYLLV